jgi:hypothetical protein
MQPDFLIWVVSSISLYLNSMDHKKKLFFFLSSPHSPRGGRSRRYLVDKSFRFDQKDPLVATVSHFSFLFPLNLQGQTERRCRRVMRRCGYLCWLSSSERWWCAWKVKGQPVMAVRCEIAEEREALRSVRQPCGTTSGLIWSTTSPGYARRIEQGNFRCEQTKIYLVKIYL